MDLLNGRFAARQVSGGREYQEDDYGLIDSGDSDTDESEVLLIADGMGGHVSGDMASRIVVKIFVEIYHSTEGPVPDRLRTCLNAANDALAEVIRENPELKGMGSTVVAAVFSQHGLDWISVGDSPLWLFRDGKLRRLNADHSMAPVLANLVAVGRMTKEEAAADPKRHALRSAVMGDEMHLIDVSSQPIEIEKSDCVLLASDGLMTLEDGEIAHILQNMQDASLSDVAEALIQAVEEIGYPNQDNTTVLLYTPKADCGMETIPPDIAEEESGQCEETQRSGRRMGMFGMLLCVVLSALGLLAYWFKLSMPDKEVVTTSVQKAELTKQEASKPDTSAKTRDPDIPVVQPEAKSLQIEPPSKDISVSIESPAKLDTGKVIGEDKKIEDIPPTLSTPPDTTK